MTDLEVERALGYTPCICGVIDGTWHDACYRGKSRIGINAGYKLAFTKAREHLKKQQIAETKKAIVRAAAGQQDKGE